MDFLGRISMADLLNATVRDATRKKFEEGLVDPVKIVHFGRETSRLILPGSLRGEDCPFCDETRKLLEEVAALSDKISLEIVDVREDKARAEAFGVEMIPATVIMDAEDRGIRIYGIPSGYEYVSLLGAVLDVSRGSTALAPETKAALQAIDKDVHIQVFVTPTCAFCSAAVRLAHQFALESPHVRAEMIESMEFPDLADRFQVRGVPKTVVNGTIAFEGAVPEPVFLENVLKALA
jgi:glutaredoxin-like protein